MAVDQAKLYREIGARIRARRDGLNKTQAALAADVGLSRPSLANIERGRQNLLIHQLYILSTSLKLNIQDLLPAVQEIDEIDSEELKMPEDLTETQQLQIKALLKKPTSRVLLTAPQRRITR